MSTDRRIRPNITGSAALFALARKVGASRSLLTLSATVDAALRTWLTANGGMMLPDPLPHRKTGPKPKRRRA